MEPKLERLPKQISLVLWYIGQIWCNYITKPATGVSRTWRCDSALDRFFGAGKDALIRVRKSELRLDIAKQSYLSSKQPRA
jgi:hypothetical protein